MNTQGPHNAVLEPPDSHNHLLGTFLNKLTRPAHLGSEVSLSQSHWLPLAFSGHSENSPSSANQEYEKWCKSEKRQGKRKGDAQVLFGQLQNFLLPCPVIEEMSDLNKPAPEGGYTP